MADKKNNIERIWDAHWDKYLPDEVVDIERLNDPWTNFHLPILKRKIANLKPNSLFLEAGCGLGQWCFYANSSGHRSLGVDIAKDTIKKLNDFIKDKKEYRNIRFLVDDLNHSSLESNQFDFIVSLGVIEHFRDSLPMLKELYRLLKPQGEIFISVPNIFAFQTFTRPLSKLLGKWKIGFEKSYTANKLIEETSQAGLSCQEVGILPSGQLFGGFLTSLPSFLGRFFKKAGYFIETRQKVLGLYSYIVCRKQEAFIEKEA